MSHACGLNANLHLYRSVHSSLKIRVDRAWAGGPELEL